MPDPVQIKPHVFNEFYSHEYNAYCHNPYEWGIKRFPIHNLRAIYGNLNTKTEFKNELDVYKFRYNTETDIINLRNFITIPESQIYKYHGLFNGMIKSVKVNSISANYEFTDYYRANTTTKPWVDGEETSQIHEGRASISMFCDTSLIYNLNETQDRLSSIPIVRNLYNENQQEYIDLLAFSSNAYTDRYISWGTNATNQALHGFNGSTGIFPFNSTVKNDPVLLIDPIGYWNKINPMCSIQVGSSRFTFEGGQPIILNSKNIGNYSVNSILTSKYSNKNIVTSETTYLEKKGAIDFMLYVLFGLSPLYYINDQKNFILFIDYQAHVSDGDYWFNPVGLNLSTVQREPSPNFEKKYINIKLCDNICQIEAWNNTKMSDLFTESYPNIGGGITTRYISRQVSSSLPDIFVEVSPWKKEDFNKNLVFPPNI